MAGPYDPTTSRVALAWARRALADVGSDYRLPAPVTAAMRTAGFLQLRGAGGSPDAETPMRRPVVTFTCWMAPAAEGSVIVQANEAEILANRVLNATYDSQWWGRIDFTGLGLGNYRAAILRSVIALSEPREAPDDPNHFARFDVDVEFVWTTGV